MILFFSTCTRRTRRARPFSASSPEITSTRSSFFTCSMSLSPGRFREASPTTSNHLGGEADDAGETFLAQLTRHRAENARAARVLLGVDQHEGIAVEPDVAAVLATGGFLRPHDHALDHLAGLDFAARNRLLDAGDD